MKIRILISVFILVCSLQAKLFSQPKIDLVPFAGGLNKPVAIASAGDLRLFVVEQGGKIRIVDSSGNVNASPFLDISHLVSGGSEQGLLGLAFHPDYAGNGYFYVDYTDTNGNTVVSRFHVPDTDPSTADASSESLVISLDQPYTNHNGGDLKFGPDGYLYIATGDGGAAGDPQQNAQDSLSLLGKILRLDVDGGTPYAVPGTNPFVSMTGTLGEIWALGLRNPWRISFDRSTGDLWIADVGQGDWEEIDFQPALSQGGENYGWRCYEGNHDYNQINCVAGATCVFPVHEYAHDLTGGCAVTGGFVYRGEDFPGMDGYYFFADHCLDSLWTLHDSSGTWVLTPQGQFSGNSFATFGEDSGGELYVAGLSTGTVYRIVDTASVPIDTILTVTDTTITQRDTSFSYSETGFMVLDTDCSVTAGNHSLGDTICSVSDTSYLAGDTTYFIVDSSCLIVDTVCVIKDSSCTRIETEYTFFETSVYITVTTHHIVDSTFTLPDTSFTRSDTVTVLQDTSYLTIDTSQVVSDSSWMLSDTACTVLNLEYNRKDTSYTLSGNTSAGNFRMSGKTAGFRVYPNPAGDFLEIESDGPYEPRKPINIFDMQGRLVYSARGREASTRLDIGSLKPGVYLLELPLERKREFFRFMKR